MHRHHLIPKHMGGTDDESNITPPISIQMHAEFHRWLWEDGGRTEDYIAWKCLSGRITGEEARIAAVEVGKEKSEKYKLSCKANGERLKLAMTPELRRKGGLAAIKYLVDWISNNRDEHLKNCLINQKISAEAIKIPREFLGISYESGKKIKDVYGFHSETLKILGEKGVITKLTKEEFNNHPFKYVDGMEVPDYILMQDNFASVEYNGIAYKTINECIRGIGRSESFIRKRIKSGEIARLSKQEYLMHSSKYLEKLIETEKEKLVD